MEYTVQQAKTNLSRLLEEACSGKEVVITLGNKRVARLDAIGAASNRRVPGKLKGQISYFPDAFDPLSDKELEDMGFG